MDLNPKDTEIVVGIVARVGVDTKAIVKTIRQELEQYRYNTFEIHVTDLLKGFSSSLNLVEIPIEQRYETYIAACNKLRSDIDQSVMSTLAVMEISARRTRSIGEKNAQTRTAYIINQIKRPEEFDLLRKVYGEHYIQISCHADEEVRVNRLKVRISHDHPEDPKSSLWDIKARSLVHEDESQEDEKYGQRVRQVFPLSDAIIDANSSGNATKGIERFIRALFGDKSVTPTREEYGMELANTAAQRSSDLSRQVGAAILTSSMEVQALGCNEVPRAGGGTYWEGDEPNGRDFALDQDSNEQRRRAVLLDLVLRLKKANALASHLSDYAEIEQFLFNRDDNIISEAQLMDSLEYGRSVHAEMNAITDAARGGHAIRNCVLFSNTFPCHNCAKHIVASGISEVVYIHPYPKSYAKELVSDSIVISPTSKQNDGIGKENSWIDSEKVVFRQFIGIVGPMYARVFTKARWKKDRGFIPQFVKSEASYIRRTPISAYLATEPLLLDELNDTLRKQGYLRLPIQE